MLMWKRIFQEKRFTFDLIVQISMFDHLGRPIFRLRSFVAGNPALAFCDAARVKAKYFQYPILLRRVTRRLWLTILEIKSTPTFSSSFPFLLLLPSPSSPPPLPLPRKKQYVSRMKWRHLSRGPVQLIPFTNPFHLSRGWVTLYE